MTCLVFLFLSLSLFLLTGLLKYWVCVCCFVLFVWVDVVFVMLCVKINKKLLITKKRVTTLRRLQEKDFWNRNIVRSILPGLWRKRTGLLLSGPKSSFQIKVNFCISFGNQGPRVWRKTGEAQNPSSLKSSVKFLKSVMIWGAMMSAGVGPLCFIKSKVNAAIYQEILEHFMLPSADKLYGDADFLFQQDFSTCQHCQNHFQVLCWPWYYCGWLASQHAWPEPHIESMGYFQEKDEKQSIQQSRRAEGSIVPQADRFHATPHWCWSLC